jgi:predicted DNA-binding transcriptional regulator AlpA
MSSDLHCLSTNQVLEIVGRRRTWLYDTLKSDPTFPRPFTLGANSRQMRFYESEIRAWIESQRVASK